jgi:hypothetical protein
MIDSTSLFRSDFRTMVRIVPVSVPNRLMIASNFACMSLAPLIVVVAIVVMIIVMGVRQHGLLVMAVSCPVRKPELSWNWSGSRTFHRRSKLL